MKKMSRYYGKLFRRQRQKGQGMTEYIILVVLIAIALIVAVTQFKGALSNLFTGSATKLENVGSQSGLSSGSGTGGSGTGGPTP